MSGGGGGSNLWQLTLKEKTYKAQLLAGPIFMAQLFIVLMGES